MMKSESLKLLRVALLLWTTTVLQLGLSTAFVLRSPSARRTTTVRRPPSIVPWTDCRMVEDSAADATSETSTAAASTSPKQAPPVKCPDCNLCDGSGRILGGIAVVLPWWPIKAYRPCPNFVARGGVYERSGQGLDEIAFGRDSSFNK